MIKFLQDIKTQDQLNELNEAMENASAMIGGGLETDQDIDSLGEQLETMRFNLSQVKQKLDKVFYGQGMCKCKQPVDSCECTHTLEDLSEAHFDNIRDAIKDEKLVS
tara:strand:+ start:1334 stop:1654 length:321 start_codon:yes stop_codon:yes gene_type:complete